jgi:hypothetical protein
VDCNFVGIEDYVVYNNSSSNIDATDNWWNTVDEDILLEKNWDSNDDLNSGSVDFSGYLDEPITESPISTPRNVRKTSSELGVTISWRANPEKNVAGYIIYFNPEGDFTYRDSVDVGLTTFLEIDSLSTTDEFVVAAYNDEADQSDDLFEGNRSWYSERAVLGALTISNISSTTICGESEFSVSIVGNNTYPDGNEFILQLLDEEGSFSDAINLDTISSIDGEFSAQIPDTLDFGVVFQTRVWSSALDIYSDSVEVIKFAIPTAEIVIDSISCDLSGTLEYEGNASERAHFTWDLDEATILSGDNEGPFELEWDIFGNKALNLVVSENGCSTDTIYQETYANEILTSSFTFDSLLCEGDTAKFLFDGSAPIGSTYNWDIDDGTFATANDSTEVDVVWTTFGEKTISLSLESNGCVSQNSYVSNLDYYELPVVSFEVPSIICFADTMSVTFTGEVDAQAEFSWNFDNGIVISGTDDGPYEVSWESSGVKTLELEVTQNGCSSSYTQEVLHNDSIAAVFSYETLVCGGDSTELVFTGTELEGLAYNWELSDATILTENDTTDLEVFWDSFGDKSISLSVELNGCESETYAAEIHYNANPNSSFLVEEILCFGDTLTITYDGSIDEDINYSWDFDEASVISGEGSGPYEIIWDEPGTKTVSLEVDQDGCSSYSSSQVLANDEIVSSFTAESLFCGDTATLIFDGTSVNGASYLWNLQDGEIISDNDSASIEVIWDTFGEKTVELIVELNECETDVYSRVISFYDTPTSSFQTELAICEGDTTQVVFLGEVSEDANYQWSFDDGDVVSESALQEYQISWSVPGEKSISLEVEEHGCSSVSSNSLTVNETPESNFTAPGLVCEEGTAMIEYTGTTSASALFEWQFNDATIFSEEENLIYEVSWEEFGQKTISLTVTENGCYSETVTNVNYNQYPALHVEMDSVICHNENTSVTYTGGPYTTVSWQFGDAIVMSGTDVGPYELNWTTGGIKEIELEVSNAGCALDSTLYITVSELPEIPEICIVSVDEDEEKNKLVWLNNSGIASQYGVYRESNVEGEFLLVEFIEAKEYNEYIDLQSDPSQVANSYRISLVDTCGTETALSEYHKTMHLTISRGIDNDWNLIWNPYEGVAVGTYSIYRSLNGQDFEKINEVAGNITSYTDNPGASLEITYYVEVNGSLCDGGEVFGTRSNQVSKIVTNTKWSDQEVISISPNPASNILTITSDLQCESYQLFSLTGELLDSQNINKAGSIDISSLPTGVYVIRIIADNSHFQRKIIKE